MVFVFDETFVENGQDFQSRYSLLLLSVPFSGRTEQCNGAKGRLNEKRHLRLRLANPSHDP